MLATTTFLFMRVPSVTERYRTALLISGLVTFIAAYHYYRIFNSWVEAYHYPGPTKYSDYQYSPQNPRITGVPFNDAYRYMDWLLTVPLLLMEIVLVMNLPAEEANSKCWTLGIGSALMIISGYKGELILSGDLSPRWTSWCISMCFFLWVVYTLMIGLSEATNSESDPNIRDLIYNVKLVTVISWLTYPIVYTFPMIMAGGPSVVVSIQVGYCCSDIISKCGVGLMIYQISLAKSNLEKQGALLSKP